MHLITTHTCSVQVTVIELLLTPVITQLQKTTELSEQSGDTPGGQQSVAVLVKVKVRSTVSVGSFGLVRVTGTEIRTVTVKNPPPASTREISEQVISPF